MQLISKSGGISVYFTSFENFFCKMLTIQPTERLIYSDCTVTTFSKSADCILVQFEAESNVLSILFLITNRGNFLVWGLQTFLVQNFENFFHVRWIILFYAKLRLKPCEVRTHARSVWSKHQKIWKSQKSSKLQFGWRWPLEVIVDQLLYCQPSWIAEITRNYQNGCHGSTINHRHLKQKPNTTKFGSIVNFEYV